MSDATSLRGGGLLLLMLCPAIAVSDTVVNAIGFGAAVLIAAPLAGAAFLIMQRWLTADVELPAALLLMGGVIGCLELLLRAYFHSIYGEIGLFAPLAAVNCAIIGALTIAREGRGASFFTVVKAAAAIAGLLLLLGFAREVVGRGSILHGAGDAFGDWARPLETYLFRVDLGFLLGMLPPGAFIALGLLIAFRNWALARRARH